jgi:putative aldouronate transport system permease protein
MKTDATNGTNLTNSTNLTTSSSPASEVYRISPVKSRFRLGYDGKKSRSLFLLGLPAMLVLLVFQYFPMFGIVIAFKDYKFNKGLLGSDWVGFDNFKFFFTSEKALIVTRNTLALNALFIVIGTIISIIFALMLFELGRRMVKLFQTVLFFPFFVSWVVASFAFYALLNYDYGAINNILKMFGAEPVNWYFEAGCWPFLLVVINLWKNVGYSSILYYTGLMSIDSSYYEAATIDGARKLQQIRYVTIPLLAPVIILLFILNVGKIFYSDFGLFYFVPRDSAVLYSVTDVIDTYVYRALKSSTDIGMAAASGLYQSVVGFILVLASNGLISRFSKENAMF